MPAHLDAVRDVPVSVSFVLELVAVAVKEGAKELVLSHAEVIVQGNAL